MTYYAFHARDFLTQTRMADGDDIRKACDKIFRFSSSLHPPTPHERACSQAIYHMNIMWTADIRMKWRCDHHSCDCDWSNRKANPKNVFGASTGFEPMVSVAVLHQLSYEDPHVASRSIYWIHRTRERNELIWILFELRTYEWNEDVTIAVVIAIYHVFGLTLGLLKSQSQLRWSHLLFIWDISLARCFFECSLAHWILKSTKHGGQSKERL